MRKFTRISFALALLLFLIAAVISVLGAMDFFTDKALPSGLAWLSLGLSFVMALIGFGSLVVEYAKAVAPEWNDDNG